MTNDTKITPAKQPHKPGRSCPDDTKPGQQANQKKDDDCCPPDPADDKGVPAIKTDEKPCVTKCICPPPPPGNSNCFDQMIAEQAAEINAADRAKAFKGELEALLGKAKAAQEGYTLEKYTQLLERWKQQDRDIAELIPKAVCGTCWYCQLECQVCSLFNKIRDLELALKGPAGKTGCEKMYSLKDQRYWQERDVERKQAMFDRVKLVLAAWEKPAAGIETALNDNQKLIDSVQLMAPDSGKALYDVFIRLVPRHLAIAPPADIAKTLIDEKFTKLCCCDHQDPDDCCGPDVGEQTVRRRMLGQYAYLVKPDDYFAIICCLVKTRFLPAKDALSKADTALKSTEAEIKRVTDEIKARMESLEKDAKAELAKEFKCDGQPDEPECGDDTDTDNCGAAAT